jgi:hypothetical protein
MLFGVLGCASCVVNPFRAGPGRVEVTVTKASIATTSPAQRIRYPLRDPAYFPRETLPLAIQFELTSRTDLARYFLEDWTRLIQVRCTVTGAETGREYEATGGLYYGPIDLSETRMYRAFGAEPYFGMVDLSHMRANRIEGKIHLSPGSDGKYRYTVYAFLDLKAGETEYVMGSPRSTFDLAAQRFESVGCYVIGVAMAPVPVLFPRTNDFTMTYAEFAKEMRAVQRAN